MKKLRINPLDPASVRAALRELERYESLCEKAADVYTKALCSIGREAAYFAYNSANVRLEIEKTDKGHQIVASHSGGQIAFLEFGAGVSTQNHELSAPLGIEIAPGSWSRSDEGKGTYDKWAEEHNGNMSGYPYNRRPRQGMLEAAKAIMNGGKEAAEEAAEVFK